MPTVYIETTIPSYLAAFPSRDLITAAHQQITHEWWRVARERFDHIANGEVIRRLTEANMALNRLTPLIITPEEILESPGEIET